MAEQQNSSHDGAIGWAILFGIAAVLLWLLWWFQEYEIKSVFRWFRWGEMYLISFLVDNDQTFSWNGVEINFMEWFNAIPDIPKDNLDGQTMAIISTLAMKPFRFIFVIGLALMGFWALMFGPGTEFRRKMNLDGLIKAQSGAFPVISPFVKFNPSSQPPRPPGSPVPAELPEFAEALGPEEWLAFNQIPVPDGKLDEEAAFVAFSQQLGPRWQGPSKLPPYKQILLAAFCLKASRKRAEADDILGRAAQCWSLEKGFQHRLDKGLLKEARKALRNKNIAAKTLALCNQHAFQTTALLRGLRNARDEGGVLAPAQFVWLRAHDRNLWYPLNNLGRQSFHMEAIGAISHFKAERLTQRPIPKPKVQNAIDTIRDYIESTRARPIPQLDYSASKKRGVKKPRSAGVKKPKSKKAT